MGNRPLLERVALRYFQHLGAEGVRRDDRVHILDEGERAQMWRIERGAIIRSGIAGALSSVVSGLAEVYSDAHFPVVEGSGLLGRTSYWGVVLGATVVASIFEIAFLYWDALRSVHRLAAAAGLPLEVVEGEGIPTALARAALELPNPPGEVLGVDPGREVSKTRLAMIALLYKGKIAVSSFVVKMLLRRVLARAVARATIGLWLPFVPVLVTAVWNAVVTWLVVREARVRALGPSMVGESLGELWGDVVPGSRAAAVMVRAVASTIVRKQTLHPNLHALLVAVHGMARVPDAEELDDPARFLSELRALPAELHPAALRLLCVALVIDGKTSARDKKLMDDAGKAAGIDLPIQELEALRRAFISGDGFTPDLLRSLARPAAAPGASPAQSASG
ncbi:MAG TPA: hypothetical protein VIG99_07845 [Myxococcaceae bacterium]|jgi:hypothetical protein